MKATQFTGKANSTHKGCAHVVYTYRVITSSACMYFKHTSGIPVRLHICRNTLTSQSVPRFT